MKWPTSRQLTIMRETIEETLPDLCTVSRPGSATVDAWGEQGTGVATTTANIPCAHTTSTGQERLAGGGVVPVGHPIVTLKYDTDVRPEDTITIVPRSPLGALTFRVVSPLVTTDPLAVRVLAAKS